jgi:hypothetical protein
MGHKTHRFNCKRAFVQPKTASATTLSSVQTRMQHPHYADLINRAAQALFTGAPSALLARECDVLVAKATARSWRKGHRRAPVAVLKRLRRMLQVRGAECFSLCRDFDLEIARREGELPWKRRGPGFMQVRERDGPGSVPRDGRNRLGRPKRNTAADRGVNYAGRGR